MTLDRPLGQIDLNGIDPIAKREFSVRKRDGSFETFNEGRILIAIESAFKAEAGLGEEASLTDSLAEAAQTVAATAVRRLLAKAVQGEELEVEKIQDTVEDELMSSGHHHVARRYIIYREERRKARALRQGSEHLPRMLVRKRDGSLQPLRADRIYQRIADACHGFEKFCSARELYVETLSSLYDGVRAEEIDQALILAARSRVEREPRYAYIAARFLLSQIYKEVLGVSFAAGGFEELHQNQFANYIQKGVEVKRLSPELLEFNLKQLSQAMKPERDSQFAYLGLQTIYDRYLIHHQGKRLETPQYFWMRVSMGLALNEGEKKNEKAIEFYHTLSQFLFVSSTPTLFNAGTCHPQLSSCYLSTVMDDLEHIFKVISDDAKLSKWAGGLGNDWTNVRATGSLIRGTNGQSQGVIPFLKVANDTAVAVNQGGKRKGAMCAYLETWHLDIEDFLELRKNTGDERRRTHDMNTANWIPDLFMKRVEENGAWTLFTPSDTPDLHDLYGQAFEKRYLEYEKMAENGEIVHFKRVDALSLWRKMLTMLFETGHPWITFKDPSNIRSPQDHAGVVHSSNLCTEILLNTSADETAVCNLGSINLLAHINAETKSIDEEKLARTVRTAMRMLDHVVDINFYPTAEAKNSNLKHRPVGLGIMGFQDALYQMRVSYASQAAVEFADKSMELISYYAILASSELAAEKGTYPSYPGSKWSRGLLPIDTIDLLEKERGRPVEMNRSTSKDWTTVREAVARHGMRNSNCMAIAPTATIANITGISQSIEPTYKNLYAKSNLSGEFTTINSYLVEDLRREELWDEEMIDDLKYYDGSLQLIERIPQHLKELYRTAFEIEPMWLIECASRRQKWIDMGQSLNLYIAEPNGKKLSDMYQLAWRKGLKTTYYLRSLAATQIEKSTTDINKRGLQPRWMKNKSASANIQVGREASPGIASTTTPAEELQPLMQTSAPKACSILDPTCESCQ